jgi:hypothetical protein
MSLFPVVELNPASVCVFERECDVHCGTSRKKAFVSQLAYFSIVHGEPIALASNLRAAGSSGLVHALADGIATGIIRSSTRPPAARIDPIRWEDTLLKSAFRSVACACGPDALDAIVPALASNQYLCIVDPYFLSDPSRDGARNLLHAADQHGVGTIDVVCCWSQEQNMPADEASAHARLRGLAAGLRSRVTGRVLRKRFGFHDRFLAFSPGRSPVTLHAISVGCGASAFDPISTSRMVSLARMSKNAFENAVRSIVTNASLMPLCVR